MNGRKGKYNGEALKTFEKVIDGRNNYIIDVLHKNEKHNIFWYINNEKSSGISYFEAESGKALLCPCRL